MTLRHLLAYVFFGFSLLTNPLLKAQPPNIIFIVADDMGYADLSSFGAPDIETPHIDRIGKEGIKFTNIYAMGPECTPSRVSFLTGRYPQRVGGMECAIGTGNVGRYDDAIRLAQEGELGLPPSHSVLAPKLKEAGYRNAIFGKWHLGYEEKFSPLDQGFDRFIGFLGGNVDYFRHRELSDIDVYLSDRDVLNNREGYTTELITQDAIKFLEESHKGPETPFFLYLPHAAPHFPFQGPEDDDGTMPAAADWTKGTRETYLRMMENLDQSVGEVLKKVETIGVANNTIIVFTSDHGAMEPGLNIPWRDYKGTLFEGGIRVPLLVRWPAKIAPGSTSDQVGSLMDLTKSFLRAAGIETGTLNLDGEDLFTLALNRESTVERTLHWRAKRSPRIWSATRNGKWKWIRKDNGGHVSEWLFNLDKDPHEKDNLLEKQMTPRQRATHAMLKRTHEAWEAEVATGQ